MSTNRLTDYAGRHWALKSVTDSDGQPDVTVHHFSTFEMREAWVAMDPALRIPVSPFHKEVRAWLKADPAYVSWWGRAWDWIAKIGRR